MNDDYSDDREDWFYPQVNWLPAWGQLPIMYPFSGTSCFNTDLSNFTSVQFYELFVSQDLIIHFVVQAELYAEQFIRNNPNLPPHSRVHAWLERNETKMKQFLWLLMLMGIIHKPDLEMYWSTPVFAAVMTWNRFSLLMKFFHLNNNSHKLDRNVPNRDRLFKLHPLIGHLFEAFQVAYMAGPSVAIDETLLLWKGKLHFQQFLHLKRAHFGIKMFCISECSGCIYWFYTYIHGREYPSTSISAALPYDCKDFGMTEKLVVYLAGKWLYHLIWTDNWFSICWLSLPSSSPNYSMWHYLLKQEPLWSEKFTSSSGSTCCIS